MRRLSVSNSLLNRYFQFKRLSPCHCRFVSPLSVRTHDITALTTHITAVLIKKKKNSEPLWLNFIRVPIYYYYTHPKWYIPDISLGRTLLSPYFIGWSYIHNHIWELYCLGLRKLWRTFLLTNVLMYSSDVTRK